MFVITLASLLLAVPLFIHFLPSEEPLRSGTTPSVAVIVCAKNEENTIRGCILSLLEQNYPLDKVKIVVVDDGSTDQTLLKLQEFKNHDQISILELKDNAHKKAGALNYALDYIDFSSAHYILFTDADCRASASWVQHMVDSLCFFDVVGGETIVENNQSLIGKLQSLEWSEAFRYVDLAQNLNLPPIIMGNNLGVKSSFFMDGLSFRSGNWVEDAALLKDLRDIGAQLFFSKRAQVFTVALSSLSAVVNQRWRWLHGLKYLCTRLKLFFLGQALVVPVMLFCIILQPIFSCLILFIRSTLLFFLFNRSKKKFTITDFFLFNAYSFVWPFLVFMRIVFRRSLTWK